MLTGLLTPPSINVVGAASVNLLETIFRAPELYQCPGGTKFEPLACAQANIFQNNSLLFFVRASGEAILGTQRYLSKHFLIHFLFVPSARRVLGTQR